MLKNLLYLHGFRSSPKSFKAQYLEKLIKSRYPQVQWTCPQLPPSPQEAAQLILELTSSWSTKDSAVVGSSLGGFYADWLYRERGFKCALINPATDPARDLKHYIGNQTTWQNPSESFYFKEHYLSELERLYHKKSNESKKSKKSKEHEIQSPDKFGQESFRMKLLMACTGDEVLNWQEMVSEHPDAKQYIVNGSDHAMSDFDQHIGVLINFLDI